MNHALRISAGAIAIVLVLLAAGCAGRGSGSSGGVNPQPPVEPPVEPPGEPRDWGSIPPEPRGPGEVVSAPFVAQIDIVNDGAAREETLFASVPFAWGHAPNLDGLTIAGHDTAWRVLQRWPDRSVRVAQAQWRESLAGNDSITHTVASFGNRLLGDFQPHPVFAAGLPDFGSDVSDRFGVVYTATATGNGEVLQETPLARVRRWRTYHRAAAGVGIDRDFLTSTFYVTEFRDEPVVLVDWVLGNDYLGADDPNGSTDPELYPLGDVDVNEARFRHRNADLALSYRAVAEGIGAAVPAADGFEAIPVMQNTFVGDGQTRRYRFLLLRDDPAATPVQVAAARAAANQRIDSPVQTLATRDSWQQTHALGLLGGPAVGPTDAAVRADIDWNDWTNGNHFGTWGSHGDVKSTGQTGTPRNHPITPALVHALQSHDLRLLTQVEQLAWIQAARPYHLHGLRVENDDPVLLWSGVPGPENWSPESFGRRNILQQGLYENYRVRANAGERAHDFSPFDVEHWSMEAVFDYWTITGDAWAQAELRLLGENLRGLLRPVDFFTSTGMSARAEGWCMQGFVQAFLATDQLRFRDAALDRAHDIVDRDRTKNGPHRALSISSTDPRTMWPGSHEFYMPWQHGGVLQGYLAGWKFFGDPLLLEICEDVSLTVQYGWVRNVVDPIFGVVADGLRYYVPLTHEGQPVLPTVFDISHGVSFGDSPLGGAHTFLTSGLLLLHQASQDPASKARALEYGELLLQAPLSDDDRWNKWFFTVPAAWNH